MLRVFIRNMSSHTIAVKPPIPVFGIEGRYVSALYSAAHQMKELDKVEEYLQELQKVIDNPGVNDFLKSSMMSRTAKAKILSDIAKGAGMPIAAANFLAVVAENGRLKKLKRMITLFHNVMVAHHNEAPCEVITAKPLDESTRANLRAALEKFVKQGKKIQLTEKVDPSIIGGMIVGVEDKHIDMSIARKVQMYTQLLKQAV